MLAWRRSTKGMLCRQSIAHKFSVCDSNFTALGGSEVPQEEEEKDVLKVL